jgi:hypothetical protein
MRDHGKASSARYRRTRAEIPRWRRKYRIDQVGAHLLRVVGGFGPLAFRAGRGDHEEHGHGIG